MVQIWVCGIGAKCVSWPLSSGRKEKNHQTYTRKMLPRLDFPVPINANLPMKSILTDNAACTDEVTEETVRERAAKLALTLWQS